MRKNILLLLLFFTSCMFAQTFTFNHLMHYACKADNASADIIIYVNTENPQFYLSVYNSYPSKKAKLYDMVKSRVYNFEVIENKVNNQIVFGFTYQSFDYIKIPRQKNSQFLFEEKEHGIQYLNIYKKNKKVENYFVEINTQPSDKDLFSAFKFFALHPYNYNLNLKNSSFIKVTKAKIKNHKMTVNYELLSDKPISLELKIPKN